MNGGSAVLIVRGFAVPEGRNKWACCYEIRLASASDGPLVHRGELHGRAFCSEDAAVIAAREAGEREARRRIAAGLATSFLSVAPGTCASKGGDIETPRPEDR
ncbi:hypothetical protein B551_0201080 [Cupriavidus sp. HPC(L)]|uniref:hypothetical protein n=1 Tax=Cupriavidus sp. HPC(L) TaxID=1217418 RepID=UPI000291B872|nr:hypothetical protein [Cupriavidus sp. HPC(L)]ESJ26533.1 hypothetical protein B551_0201080 [Cupriavidus sp. HPC(L)]